MRTEEEFIRNIITPNEWDDRCKKDAHEDPLYIGTPSSLRDRYHNEGWYNIIYEKNTEIAKQCFYLCGLCNEATNKLVGHLKVNHNMGNNNANALDGYFRTLDVMLSDNKGLLSRRMKLSYPEREGNIFKEKYITSITNEVIYCILSENWGRFNTVFPLLHEVKFAKKYTWDIVFFEGLLEKNTMKMAEAIERIASPKIHTQRQKFNVDDCTSNWENAILSLHGITYTKLAWMLGYELEIKAPLVNIAQELFPIKPLNKYDEVYYFLRQMPEPLKDWY
jgi:hypothetical protein